MYEQFVRPVERMNDAPSAVLDVASESCCSEFLQDSTSCEAETRSDQPLSLTRLSAYWPVLECDTHPREEQSLSQRLHHEKTVLNAQKDGDNL